MEFGIGGVALRRFFKHGITRGWNVFRRRPGLFATWKYTRSEDSLESDDLGLNLRISGFAQPGGVDGPQIQSFTIKCS